MQLRKLWLTNLLKVMLLVYGGRAGLRIACAWQLTRSACWKNSPHQSLAASHLDHFIFDQEKIQRREEIHTENLSRSFLLELFSGFIYLLVP